MKPRLPESFQSTIGLTGVFATDPRQASTLPEDSRLQPSHTAVDAQLRVLLHAQTVDVLILEAVRPRVADRAVLAPALFHALREQITARLTTLRATSTDPVGSAELDAALTLLLARSREHELGETFRYALLKG